MKLDVIGISILFGVLLNVIYIYKSRNIPKLNKVLSIFLIGPIITYGFIFIGSAILKETTYITENRIFVAFGGLALLWTGLQNYLDKFIEDYDIDNGMDHIFMGKK